MNFDDWLTKLMNSVKYKFYRVLKFGKKWENVFNVNSTSKIE